MLLCKCFFAHTHAMSAQQPASHTSANRTAPSSAARQARVVQLLRVVYRTMQEHSRQIEREFGVSTAQLAALWALADHPGARVSELSQTLALHQSTTSNMLDKLEKKGLIERHRGDSDQRAVQVYLGTAGKALLADAPRPTQGAIEDALAQLPDPSLASLEESLKHLVARMDSSTGPGGETTEIL